MNDIQEYLNDLQRQKKIMAYIYSPGDCVAELLMPDGRQRSIVFSTLQELQDGFEPQVPGQAATSTLSMEVVVERKPTNASIVFDSNATDDAKLIMATNLIDPAMIAGTGKDGKITVRDVNKFLNANKSGK